MSLPITTASGSIDDQKPIEFNNIHGQSSDFLRNMPEDQLPQLPKPSQISSTNDNTKSSRIRRRKSESTPQTKWVLKSELQRRRSSQEPEQKLLRPSEAQLQTQLQDTDIKPSTASMMSPTALRNHSNNNMIETGQLPVDNIQKMLKNPSSEIFSSSNIISRDQSELPKQSEGTLPSVDETTQQRFETRNPIDNKAEATTSDIITTGASSPIQTESTQPTSTDRDKNVPPYITTQKTKVHENEDIQLVGSPRHV